LQGKREVPPMRFIGLILILVCAAASDMRAEGGAACVGWLTGAEVEAALGTKLETMDPVEYSPGFTVCSWTKDRPEGQLGVNLSFFEMQAIREGMVSAESIPEYFDLQVSSKKEQSGAEPQALEGIGKRAALFSEDHLWIVMIELEEGFAHLAISPGDVTRAQVEAMAKAAAKK
jgi:hypothetical protein